MCHREDSFLKHYSRESFPNSDYKESLKERIYEPIEPSLYPDFIGERFRDPGYKIHPSPRFLASTNFLGKVLPGTSHFTTWHGHEILPTPTCTQNMCTVNHQISDNNSLRPLIASHMKLSKILVRRAVICCRLASEFIFICQNANVNGAERTFVSGGKGGRSINVFGFFPPCPTSLLFYSLLGGELF